MPEKIYSEVLRSYAKINLGLKIINKRDDGFHNIETIFHPVFLHDIITAEIKPAEEDHNSVVIHSNKSFVPTDRKNICYKMIEHFFVMFGIKEHYHIELNIEKNIPVGGGLGGGSSNAASMIKFLVRYFNIDVKANSAKLLKTALDCGSDIPFFLVMKPCFAQGRGENMKILKDFRLNYKILLVNPNLHISTKWAFEHLNMNTGAMHSSELGKVSSFDPLQKAVYENDFEKVVFEKYPLLAEIKQELYESGAVFASMSGSGATMYGLFEDKSNAVELTKKYNSSLFFTYLS